MTARDHEREETFARLYQSGKTLQQIANQHAVTRQYVHAVLKRAGIQGRPTGRKAPDLNIFLDTIRQPYVLTAADIAANCRCAVSTVYLTLDRLGKRQAVQRLLKWRKRALRNSK